jgi:hypothetical protein
MQRVPHVTTFERYNSSRSTSEKSPDKLGPSELRSYRAYLLKERKLTVGTVVAQVAALRFFFVRTLKRHRFREDLPFRSSLATLPSNPFSLSSSILP